MSDPAQEGLSEAKVYFIKTPNYVEIPVHGAFGGINLATGQLHMSMYSERSPLPQELVYQIDPAGTAQEVLEKRIGKEGPVRIVQVVLHFDINTAVALRNWMNDKIDRFSAAHPEFADKLEEIE